MDPIHEICNPWDRARRVSTRRQLPGSNAPSRALINSVKNACRLVSGRTTARLGRLCLAITISLLAGRRTRTGDSSRKARNPGCQFHIRFPGLQRIPDCDTRVVHSETRQSPGKRWVNSLIWTWLPRHSSCLPCRTNSLCFEAGTSCGSESECRGLHPEARRLTIAVGWISRKAVWVVTAGR